MTRAFTIFRWVRRKLLVMALAGFALSMSTVNAHLLDPSYGDQQEGATRVPSAGSPRVEQETRARAIVPSKRYEVLVAPEEVAYVLDPLDPNALVATNPRQIGLVRAVGISSETQGKLFINPDGSKIRILALTSPGAEGIRVHFERFDIPVEDEVYVHGVSEESQAAGPYTGKGPFGDGEFWTDTIEGETAIIEHYIKGEEQSIYISEISHNFRSILAEETALAVLNCHNDAMCYGDPEKNAVGRIVFVEGSAAYVCTGTMLNNRTVDFAPYFLTANHCVSTQDVARTVETYWFYRTTACNSGVLSSGWVRTPTGASLLATQQSADSSLLRIFNAVPGGLVYSGWDSAAKSVNTPVFGLHHPDGYVPPSLGSYLRRSSGFIASTSSSCSASGLVNGYNADWTSGTIEGGASGSGLWYTQGGNNYLVGVLSCGPDPDYCESYGLYGKFSNFFPTIQTYMDQGDSGGNCAATAINVGQTINGSLATTDCRSRVRGVSYYADRYSFSASAGQQVALLVTSSAFDTYVYLLGPDKTVVAQDDDGGGGTNSRIPPGSGFYSLPSSGTYTIEVTSYSTNRTGNYTLNLREPTQPGQITIIKDAVPNDPQDFAYSGSLGGFSLDDDADPTLPNMRTFSNLDPGSYTVTEGAVAGWSLTNLVCSDPDGGTTVNLGARTATIDLDAGEAITCTFTNTKVDTGTIHVRATRNGASWSGSVSYTLTGPTTITGSSVPATFSSSPTGTYTLTYNSGGPSGACLIGITPSPIQTLSLGGIITFTLNFSTSCGTIQVKATLNGAFWSGSVGYTLTGPVTINGSSAPATFANRPTGAYTLTYNSGGPSGATFVGITPSSTQTLLARRTITFTLNFSIPVGETEPNDTTSQAQIVSIPSIVDGSASPGGDPSSNRFVDINGNGRFDAGIDDWMEDFFRISINVYRMTLTITLDAPNRTEANLNLYLARLVGSQLSILSRSTLNGTPPERITYSLLRGTYYIIVTNFDPGPTIPTSYTLTISSSSGAGFSISGGESQSIIGKRTGRVDSLSREPESAGLARLPILAVVRKRLYAREEA